MKSYLILIPVVSAILLGGCSLPFVSQTVEQTKQAVEQKAAETAILANCKYDQAICQYMAAQVKAFSSGMTLTSTTTNKAKTSSAASQSVSHMDGQGNMQIISTENGKETGNMIVLNKVTYFKDYEANQWFKMTSADDQTSSASNPESFIENLKENLNSEEITTTYTKLGQEPCGDMAPKLTCDIYQVSDTGEVDFTSKVWIDTTEHLTRKMEMDLSDGGVNTTTYTYGPVTITEPSPVKEFTTPELDLQKMMENLPVETPEE